MRAFVLSTGRCGTTTFAKACGHIDNYTAAHESRSGRLTKRLDYPDGHIESDNRLSWMLGSLDKKYGDAPVYVHLTRDVEETARSYSVRFRGPVSIVRAYGQGIIQNPTDLDQRDDWLEVSRRVVETVNDNIRLFLRDKSKVVHVQLEDFHRGFDRFWQTIGATGDVNAAHDELDVRHNKRSKR